VAEASRLRGGARAPLVFLGWRSRATITAGGRYHDASAPA
jgi:hypothetical protein